MGPRMGRGGRSHAATAVGRPPGNAVVAAGVPAARMLTLTGAGGVGKTRLAMAVGAEAGERFPDGVWFVDLAPLRDAALIPSAVAEACGVPEPAGRPPAERLVEHLRG